MRTVKSEKEKERIRERVKEIGGKAWEDGYKEIADTLDELSRVTKDSLDATAKIEDTFATLGDSLSIAREADRDCRIKVVPFDDTIYTSVRPAYEEIEDIYHQWFPEDGDAPFTKEVFKELPKRIIASALETIVASEITEMLLSLTSVKRRDYDTPFLSHFKKRIKELRKRFSLNTTNISKLTIEELERNFSLPRNDSYYSLLNYLFGPEPDVPSIKDFVEAKHPGWFTYYGKPGDDSSKSTKTSSYSLDDEWFVYDHISGKTKTMSGREIVVGLEKGTLSEDSVFRDLPRPVQTFIKEELKKYKDMLPHDSWHICGSTGKIKTMTSTEIVDAIIAGTLSEEDAFRTLPGTVKDFVKREVEKYKHTLLYGDWEFSADEKSPMSKEVPSDSEKARVRAILEAIEEGCIIDPRITSKPMSKGMTVTRGGSTVTFSDPTEKIKRYYSVVDPETEGEKLMTAKEIKELFRESRDAFMESRTSKCEHKD